MHPLAVVRTRAYLQDAARFLGLAVATVPVGITVHRSAAVPPRPGTIWAISAVLPVVATVWMAREESRPERATWGKRSRGLEVTTTDGDPPRFARAMLRNTVKIAVPWQLGHTVAIGAANGGFERGSGLLAVSIGTYAAVGALIGSVALGSGRGIHDRIAGTVVRRCSTGSE